MEWTPSPIQTSWDDLLEGIETAEAWAEKRLAVWDRFLSLIREEVAPIPPTDLNLRVERQWDAGEFTIQYVSYQVEVDERAHAYMGIPSGDPPTGGYPGVVCLHGTTNGAHVAPWGSRLNPVIPARTQGASRERTSLGSSFVRTT